MSGSLDEAMDLGTAERCTVLGRRRAAMLQLNFYQKDVFVVHTGSQPRERGNGIINQIETAWGEAG